MPSIGSCIGCNGWGPVDASGFCRLCSTHVANADTMQCKRCGTLAPLGKNLICASCAFSAKNPVSATASQGNQLFFTSWPFKRSEFQRSEEWTLENEQRRASRRFPARPPVPTREQLEDHLVRAFDSNQLSLFEAPTRKFTAHTAALLPDNFGPAWASEVVACAQEYSKSYSPGSDSSLRLIRLVRVVAAALAVDGLDECTFDYLRLCASKEAVAECFRAAGRMKEAGEPSERRGGLVAPRSTGTKIQGRTCVDCGNWGPWSVCERCRWWRRVATHVGDCLRCGSADVPLRWRTAGERWGDMPICRACDEHLTQFSDGDNVGEVQLRIDWRVVPQLLKRGYKNPGQKNGNNLSTKLIFVPIVDNELVQLEVEGKLDGHLSRSVLEFISEAKYVAESLEWTSDNVGQVIGNLRLLYFRAKEPHAVSKELVEEVVRSNRKSDIRRTVYLLNELGFLEKGQGRPLENDSSQWLWFRKRIEAHSVTVQNQILTWLESARGQGSRKRRVRSWERLRSFYYHMRPFLLRQDATRGTLTGAETYEIEQFVSEGVKSGQGMRSSGLRLLYASLKLEGMIDHNPAEGVPARYVRSTPNLADPERIANWFQKSTSTLHRAVVGLVALHALTVREVCEIRAEDLTLGSRLLTVRRVRRTRRILLDSVSMELILEWLEFRDEAFSGSSNPYLFVSNKTAFSTEVESMAPTSVGKIIARTGVNARKMREDRIMYEAASSRDPVVLMRLFGLSSATAMRYIASVEGRPNFFN